ncbi:MAG: hypothetical protein HY248_04770 [Fimbriimonas ginsengisoli]|nr:hypothetical protein [Fimbriimonas ginsengisoli]
MNNADPPPYQPRPCPQCGAVLPVPMPRCPNCGKLLERKPSVLEIVLYLGVAIVLGVPLGALASCLVIALPSPARSFGGSENFFVALIACVVGVPALIFWGLMWRHRRG